MLGYLLDGARQVGGEQGPTWREQIELLRRALDPFQGIAGAKVYFEWSVPRVGKRVDVVLVIRKVVFVLEFKVGAKEFLSADRDQVWDYALDLKNFHETSHDALVCPVLVATEAPSAAGFSLAFTVHDDRLYCPVETNGEDLGRALAAVLKDAEGSDAPTIDADAWEQGRYSPTPTIIEAAIALYREHEVEDIATSSAEKPNLARTAGVIHGLIETAQRDGRKCICFVTGVPGAGKTLVGLTVATEHSKPEDKLHTVFLSGNGPLVTILREALARDLVRRDKERGVKSGMGRARSTTKAFIQNVHHFRDDCIEDPGPRQSM